MGLGCNIEKVLLRSITTRLPVFRGSGAIANQFAKFFARKPRPNYISKFHGVLLEVNPHEVSESELLFAPQLYDRVEFDFLKSNIKKGDTFVDLGACIGCYTLVGAKLVGEQGRVVAVEAVPENYEILGRNIKLNKLNNVSAMNVGVLDSNRKHRISVSIRKNDKRFKRGLNSFLRTYPQYRDVECYTLYSLMKRLAINRIDSLKIDIEGLEFRVLNTFFREAKESITLPRFIILEQSPKFVGLEGNAVRLLLYNGYQIVRTIRYSNNYILHRVI